MAKATGKKGAKKPAKKKTGRDVERLLNEIRRRNEAIMKECRKIEDLLWQAKAAAVARADEELCCPEGISISEEV